MSNPAVWQLLGGHSSKVSRGRASVTLSHCRKSRIERSKACLSSGTVHHVRFAKTVEESSVNDNGRDHEMIQGRALITPDELIGLKNEVIVFAPDTNPLKLPLTSPIAYEQALAYDPPDRERHEVSEFVRKRGRTAGSQSDEPKQESPTRNRSWRNGKSQKQKRTERTNGRFDKKDVNDRTSDPRPNRQSDRRSDGTPPDYSD